MGVFKAYGFAKLTFLYCVSRRYCKSIVIVDVVESFEVFEAFEAFESLEVFEVVVSKCYNLILMVSANL